jgi:hypothetical protein
MLACDATGGVRVLNWRTGETVTETAAYFSTFNVQEDGKLTYEEYDPDRNTREFGWISSGVPVRHPVRDALSVPAIAKDRLLYRTHDGFRVRTLAGDEVARFDDPAVVGLDFDGDRVAWLTRPCVRGALIVWDLEGTPPAMPGGQCPFPRLDLAAARIDERRRLRLALECPKHPSLGCLGEVTLLARSPRRGHSRGSDAYLGSDHYRISPGGRRVKKIELVRRRVCVDGRGLADLKLVVRADTRPGSAVRRRLKTRRRAVRPGRLRTTRC